jgi:hypothetical protein
MPPPTTGDVCLAPASTKWIVFSDRRGGASRENSGDQHIRATCGQPPIRFLPHDCNFRSISTVYSRSNASGIHSFPTKGPAASDLCNTIAFLGSL